VVNRDRKSREVSSSLKHFYDSYGWRRDDEDGALHGSIIHEDQDQAVQNYAEINELRYKPLLREGGSYFLDIGCSAKPRTELAENFREHICLDISIVGLTEARKNLGSSGQYILADMTELPFKSDVCDAALVCHCLYHVDKDLQVPVLKELYRIIKPTKRILVFYSSRHNLITAAHLPFKFGAHVVNLLLHRFGLDLRPYRPFLTRIRHSDGSTSVAMPSLYSYPYNPIRLAREFKTAKVSCLATLTQYDTAVLKKLRLLKVVLPVLSFLEDRFPRAMVYVGKYSCIDIEKTEKPG
jgi:ubiquinone/menaquinone biosynthesis C-methylase UbiE